ncbi:hypothetical protein KY285_020173 [Solanum tuberosum]|nr:hypothetical protein KY285_020173 [Solanum tuberosum]
MMEGSLSFCYRDPHTMSTNELFASIKGNIEKVIKLVTEMEPDELEILLNGTTHRDEEPKELHNQGEDTSCYELQGNNVNSCTSLSLKLHCVASSQLSIGDSLISCELNDSLTHSDKVFVESVHTFVDPIDDRIDSSCKINLCPPSVDTCALSDITLSCSSFPCFDNLYIENVDTLVDPIDDRVDSSSKVNLCPPSVETCALNDSSLTSDIGVDHLVCNNPLFDVDITNYGEMYSGVSWRDRIVIPLKGYQVIENPLWYNDTLSKDGTFFLEDDSISIGGVSGQKEEDVCSPMRLSFLCDLILDQDKSVNQVKRCVLDPCSWISFPFDTGNELNYGTCLVILGQDDKHNLEEFVGTFPYDGQFFLRVYNPLEGPTLCMGNGSFLTPFLYYLFVYDLVDCASYGSRSCLSREGEGYPKFIMLSLCVPSCDIMSARIFEPSCDLAYRNTLDDPNVHDTFLYYLFAYEESHIYLKYSWHLGRGFIEVYTCLSDPIMWTFFHFDPDERLGVCELVVVPSFRR